MSDGFESLQDQKLFHILATHTLHRLRLVRSPFPGETVLATRSARLLGAIVDGLLMIPAIAAIFPIAMEIGAALPGNQIAVQFVGGIAGILIGSVWYLLLNGYFLANCGQTIGKIVMKTKIVDANSEEILPLMPLFLKRFFALQVLGLISLIGNIIGLVDSLMIFRENRQCLHDDIARTKVIAVEK